MAANGLSAGRLGHDPARPAGRAGRPVAPAVNWALANRQMRWLLEKTLGIAQGRKLPRVTSRSFLRRAARRRLTRPSRRSGQRCCISSTCTPTTSTRNWPRRWWPCLEHNGLAVYVHPEQKQAGMPSIACGAVEHARRLAEHNVALLAESVRQGYHIVATEPAAALCLTHEYPQLVDDDDARLVAANSSEACSYLWKMHTLGQLQLDFRPLSATLGYHTPCHLRALQVGIARRKPLGPDSRPAAAPHRERLLGHGRHLRLAAPKLSHQPAGGLEAHLAAPRSGPASRRHRMQHLQDSDGAGHHQTNDSTPSSCWPFLRADAPDRAAAEFPKRGVDRHCEQNRGFTKD